MGSTFIPSRCALIEKRDSNFLIRGNMPLIGEDLHYALTEIEEASGVKTDGKTLFEIPIIDNVGEKEELSKIFAAFDIPIFPESDWPWWQHGINGNKLLGRTLKTENMERNGHVIWRPFEGLPENTDPQIFLHKPGWDYVGFITFIDTLMSIREDSIFYVHCQLGADRTGAFHTGYLMKHGMKTDAAIEKAAKSTSAGYPNADYMRLIRAFGDSIAL